MNVQLLYIAGSGRSGSTLLDLLLGQLDEVVSVGEFHRLNWYARENIEPCTCGQLVAECQFWKRVSQEVRQLRGTTDDTNPLLTDDICMSIDRLSRIRNVSNQLALMSGINSVARLVVKLATPKHARAVSQTIDWCEAISRVTQCKCVVDSTKDNRRMKTLYVWLNKNMTIIRLLRDGRAIAASDMRRTGVSMTEAAKVWKNHMLRLHYSLHGVSAESILTVRYEDLCRNPSAELGRICQHCGLNSPPADLGDLDNSSAHNIGGNPMRFRHNERRVVADEKWREELSDEDKREFERIAGKWNRKLGYDS